MYVGFRRSQNRAAFCRGFPFNLFYFILFISLLRSCFLAFFLCVFALYNYLLLIKRQIASQAAHSREVYIYPGVVLCCGIYGSYTSRGGVFLNSHPPYDSRWCCAMRREFNVEGRRFAWNSHPPRSKTRAAAYIYNAMERSTQKKMAAGTICLHFLLPSMGRGVGPLRVCVVSESPRRLLKKRVLFFLCGCFFQQRPTR